MEDDKKHKRHFILACFLCVSGIALLFTGLFVSGTGIISGSVLGGAGEIFLLAGAILGIDTVYSNKLVDIIRTINKTTPKEKNEETQ